jgi:hypothetical protein
MPHTKEATMAPNSHLNDRSATVRRARATLRRQLRSGVVSIYDVIDDLPEEAQGMRVSSLVDAVRGISRERIARLNSLGMRSTPEVNILRTFEEMTPDQIEQLKTLLREVQYGGPVQPAARPLTVRDVIEIRRAWRSEVVSQVELARRLGLTPGQVWRVVNGQTSCRVGA